MDHTELVTCAGRPNHDVMGLLAFRLVNKRFRIVGVPIGRILRDLSKQLTHDAVHQLFKGLVS